MSRYAIQLEKRIILFSPDDPAPLTSRVQVLVKLRVTDELTGTPPISAIQIQVQERGVVPRLASDGVGGLVGIPRQVFPGLQTTDYVLHFTVSAAGYMARDLQLKIPQNPDFPFSFAPPQVNLALHREPIIITGRTMGVVNSAATPLAGAQVSVTGIWRTPPPTDVVVAPDPPNLVALQPPLYADREAGSHFRRRNLTPVVGNDKVLIDHLLPGANSIRVSNRLGLAAGDIVLIDAEQPDVRERIAIQTVPTTAPADQATFITLEYPVSYGHRQNAIVQQVNPSQTPGVIRHFKISAFAHDTCVFLNSLNGLATAQEVQISEASGLDEYHTLMHFSVVSDADGYYRLPSLSRVAQLEMHAEKTVGAQTFTATTIFRPDYQQRENRLDFALTV